MPLCIHACVQSLRLPASLPGATSTHQHTPPVVPLLSPCLHALTLTLCSQTQHISSASVVQAGKPALLSAGLTTQMSHHPYLSQKDGFLPPHGINPTLDSQCTNSFYVWKKNLFLAVADHYVLQDDICLIWRRAHLHKSQKHPPSSSQMADDMFLGNTDSVCLWPGPLPLPERSDWSLGLRVAEAWGKVRDAPVCTGWRLSQSRRESGSDIARYRTKLAVSSLQNYAFAPGSPFPLM